MVTTLAASAVPLSVSVLSEVMRSGGGAPMSGETAVNAGAAGAEASGWLARAPPMLSNVAFTRVDAACGVVGSPTRIGTLAGIVSVAVPTMVQAAPSVE